MSFTQRLGVSRLANPFAIHTALPALYMLFSAFLTTLLDATNHTPFPTTPPCRSCILGYYDGLGRVRIKCPLCRQEVSRHGMTRHGTHRRHTLNPRRTGGPPAASVVRRGQLTFALCVTAVGKIASEPNVLIPTNWSPCFIRRCGVLRAGSTAPRHATSRFPSHQRTIKSREQETTYACRRRIRFAHSQKKSTPALCAHHGEPLPRAASTS